MTSTTSHKKDFRLNENELKRGELLDLPKGGKKELLVSLVIQTMVYRYLGVQDHTSEGGWKLPFLDLKGYDSTKPRFFEDERIDILFHGWKNYVSTKYSKEMNSLAMSAVMQNQIRKAFKNNELCPLFNPKDEYHVDVLERVVCKTIEGLLEYSGNILIKKKIHNVLYPVAFQPSSTIPSDDRTSPVDQQGKG